MNFEFSDDQRALQDQLNQQFGRAFSIDRILKAQDGGRAERKAIWDAFGALEYMGMAIPQAYGGVGFSALDLCLMAQEIGRFALPVPMLSSIYLCADAVLTYGTHDQKSALLPRLATGKTTATLALYEGMNWPLSHPPKTRVTKGALTGTKSPVLDGDLADIALVWAIEDGVQGLYQVDLAGSGVDAAPLAAIDEAASVSRIAFNDAPCERLGDTDMSLETLLARAAIPLAFEQIGLAQACLERARTYALDRVAFGRPIAGYQAIKHTLADMYVTNELALSHGYYGAWALANDAAELPQAAAGARLAAIKASEFAAAEGLHIHGGIGFTWEYPAHIYLKRARMAAAALGSSRHWRSFLVHKVKDAADGL